MAAPLKKASHRSDHPFLSVLRAKNGLGVFAKKNFKRGVRVFEVKGVFISGDEDEDIDEETRANAYRYDEERYVSPQGRIGDFLNHSCEPNAAVRKIGRTLFIVGMVPIKKSDEVLIDYSTILASDDSWEMKCRCGSRGCRGTVKQFGKLPKKLQQSYILRGMVPPYIL